MAAARQEGVWNVNLAEELGYWTKSLSSDNEVGESYRGRLEVTELGSQVRKLIGLDADPIRILDVGSGPLTTLGTVWPGRKLEVVALDPLADAYNELLDRLKLVPPTRPVPGRVEALTDIFPPDHFDFVNSANALDHSADPIYGIEQMMAVLKPGCTLRMTQFKNVGEREQYHGLHRWNLSPVDGDMEISGYGRTARLSALIPGHPISVREQKEDVFVVLVTKLVDRRD